MVSLARFSIRRLLAMVAIVAGMCASLHYANGTTVLVVQTCLLVALVSGVILAVAGSPRTRRFCVAGLAAGLIHLFLLTQNPVYDADVPFTMPTSYACYWLWNWVKVDVPMTAPTATSVYATPPIYTYVPAVPNASSSPNPVPPSYSSPPTPMPVPASGPTKRNGAGPWGRPVADSSFGWSDDSRNGDVGRRQSGPGAIVDSRRNAGRPFSTSDRRAAKLCRRPLSVVLDDCDADGVQAGPGDIRAGRHPRRDAADRSGRRFGGRDARRLSPPPRPPAGRPAGDGSKTA